VLRKVDRIAVEFPDAEFRLAVGWSFLDVGRGGPLLAHWNQGLDPLHLETEMVDPLLEPIAFDFALRWCGVDAAGVHYGTNARSRLSTGSDET
jgi:hypothetical protein